MRPERRAGPAAGADRPRYSDSRGWRQRRVCRAVPATRAALGFPASAREVDQHLGAQVRAGVSRGGLDRLARTADLHPELIFNVDYLGGTMPTLAINFSRPASQIVAQYYNLIRLGKSGYRAIHQACQEVAIELAKQIAEDRPVRVTKHGAGLPVFGVVAEGKANWSLYDLADRLRDRGWQVPAYSMPANREDLVVQRVVVRNGFSYDLAGMLVRDIRRHLDWFATQPGLKPALHGAGFHH